MHATRRSRSRSHRTEVANHAAVQLRGCIGPRRPGRLARDDGNGAAPGLGWAGTAVSDSRRLAPGQRCASSACGRPARASKARGAVGRQSIRRRVASCAAERTGQWRERESQRGPGPAGRWPCAQREQTWRKRREAREDEERKMTLALLSSTLLLLLCSLLLSYPLSFLYFLIVPWLHV